MRVALGVELDRPQQRRAHLVGQQRRGVLAEHRRVQRHLGVGAVQRLAAAVRLEVDRVAGGDERGDVGDRVVHDVPAAVALEVQRLVEVRAPGGSIVTNGRSVRSSSGSRGAAAAAAAASSTSGGNSGVTSSSAGSARSRAQGLRGHTVIDGPDLNHSVARHTGTITAC